MTTTAYLPGRVLFKGTCSVTGRPHSVSARCSLAHARVSLTKGYPTLSDLAWISEDRYRAAQSLRQKRSRIRAARQEVDEATAAGFLASVDQLRRAGLL